MKNSEIAEALELLAKSDYYAKDKATVNLLNMVAKTLRENEKTLIEIRKEMIKIAINCINDSRDTADVTEAISDYFEGKLA